MKKRLNTVFPVLLTLLVAIVIAVGQSQMNPPSTDIYLVAIEPSGKISQPPKNVTHRAGYDNQPFFMPDSKSFLYTSQRDGQADTYRLDVATGRAVQVTNTPESEYSPTPLPDASAFSVVRVEKDGAQRLWSFSFGGEDASLLLPDVKPVGYHAWGSRDMLAVFVLGEPALLQLVRLDTRAVQTITGEIGRSLHKIPGQNAISFFQKEKDGKNQIKRLDLTDRKVTSLVEALEGSQDYCWTSDGRIFMARESRLYSSDPSQKGGWNVIADFSGDEVKGITRMSAAPDSSFLALVGADKP